MCEYGCNCDIESIIFLLIDSIDENKKPIFTNLYFVIQSTQTENDLCQIPCHIEGRLIQRSLAIINDVSIMKQLCESSLDGQTIYLFKIDKNGTIDPQFKGIPIMIRGYQYNNHFNVKIEWM